MASARGLLRRGVLAGASWAWQQSALNQREYCEAHGIPLKAFGNWRAKFKAEPQPPVRNLLYRRRGLSHLDLLVPNNRAWATNASALAILMSDSLMRPSGANKEVLSPTHSLDAGTASGYFVLQASQMDWYVNGLAGFDRERAFAGVARTEGIRSKPYTP